MALSLANLMQTTAMSPPRILFYGPPGIGKTSAAAQFPDAVVIQIEDGTPSGVTLTTFGKIDTFRQVMEAVESLYTEEHQFKTVIIDSVTELQRLIFAETCSRGDEKGNAKANIEDFGYGKGYSYAQRVLEELLDGLNALRRDRGMTIVLIAHSKIERFDDPETVSYDRYQIDLHGKLVGTIERDMDAILLMKRPVNVKSEEQGFNKTRARADTDSTVLIYTEGRAAYTAKNRYNMPETLRYDPGQGYAVLAPYLPGHQPQAEEAPADKKKAA